MARLRTLNVDTKSGREDILVLDHLTEEELAGRLDLVTTVRKAVTTPAIIAFPFPVTLPDDDPQPSDPPTDNPTRGEVLSGRALAWKTLALRLLEDRGPARPIGYLVQVGRALPAHTMTIDGDVATLRLTGGDS